KTLVISFIGMATQEVAIKPNLNITLKPDTETLEEVVVVAYGTAKKSSFTGSAATIKADKITKQQNSNVSKALEGAVSGVQITSSTGQPGSEASIFVRGIGSISASKKPLIVVDGVPYEGSLNSINNADIESMTILKDAAANSLYGARGANGVVMITTKKGINGKTTVSLDAKWGINSRGVKAYKTIRDAGQYYEMFWEALKNANISTGMGQAAAAWDASQNLVASLGGYNVYDVANNQLIDPTTGRLNPNAHQLYSEDWQEDPFKNGLRQEYNISIKGGSEKTSFYASLNYLDDDSYLRNSNFKRYTGRLKVDNQTASWLKTGFNMAYAQTTTNSPNVGGSNYSSLFFFGQNIAPIYPIYRHDAEGNMIYDSNGNPAYDYGVTDGHTRPYGANANPYAQLVNDIREYTYDIISAKAYAEVKFLKDFKFTFNLSADNMNLTQVDFQTPIGGDALNVNGRSYRYAQRYFALNTNQLLTYEKDFGDHHIDVLLGHEVKSDKLTYLMAMKEQFLIPNNPELSNGASLKNATSYTNKLKFPTQINR
ncbi:SusC/RagA family TonB-linked outer membrane protein, partial [Phocaeicola massiliensis]|uniref:SusC/RagA family TonB-linked outer membrane protein n=1 Tax=Phocaeicola massiliensis TaxID=204516 RepID=UPI0020CAD91D